MTYSLIKNMKKILKTFGIIVAVLFAFYVYAAGTPISVPSAPGANWVLVSNSTGRYDYTATSSLGIEGTFATSSSDYWLSLYDKGFFFSTTSADNWYLGKTAASFSTTSTDYWKTQNNFFSTTSAAYWDGTVARWSTTSTDYWKTLNNFFSTTSAAYWDSTIARWSTTSSNYNLSTFDKGYFFSTTSVDYWKTQNNFFASTSAIFWADASTTIPKTYTANTFTAQQTFDTLTVNTVATTSKLCFGTTEDTCMTSPAVSGSAISIYPWNLSVDIPTYEGLRTLPDTLAQVDETCAAVSGTAGGYCLIDYYVSTSSPMASGALILNKIPPGTWTFNTFAYVNSATGISKIEFTIKRRTSLGVETQLFQATSTELNNLTVGLSVFQSTQLGFAFDPTDRLVMQVSGWTDSGVAKTIHYVYEGKSNYSNILTPITIASEAVAFLPSNNTFTGANTFSAPTTLQNFTAVKATTTNATTTSLYVSGAASTTFVGNIVSPCFWSSGNCLTSFSTSSAIFWANASTTLVKAYSDNTFSGTNSFTKTLGLLDFTATYGTSTLFVVSNQGKVRFQELASNGLNFAELTATSSMASNLTWTLPAVDGALGDALLTNGAGNLYFGAVAGSGTVNSGTAGQVAYYKTTTNAIFSTSTISFTATGDITMGQGSASAATVNASTTVTYAANLLGNTYVGGTLKIAGNKVSARWKNALNITTPTTTDNVLHIGNCLEDGVSVTIDKVRVVMASSTAASQMSWNISWAADLSSSTPSSLFSAVQYSSTTVTQSYPMNFTPNQNTTIPAGYCWYWNPSAASTTQIQNAIIQLFGYEN
jgi:hypothetical protein